MTGQECVRNTIMGKAVDRRPIYGWVLANLADGITQAFGSAETIGPDLVRPREENNRQK